VQFPLLLRDRRVPLGVPQRPPPMLKQLSSLARRGAKKGKVVVQTLGRCREIEGHQTNGHRVMRMPP
jgi:hypothetical protein